METTLQRPEQVCYSSHQELMCLETPKLPVVSQRPPQNPHLLCTCPIWVPTTPVYRLGGGGL